MASTPSLSVPKRLTTARSFRGNAEELRATHAGWAVTAAFYSAVHFGRAWVKAALGVDVQDHEHMRKLFRANAQLSTAIESRYEKLKLQSQQQRYYGRSYSSNEVDELLTRHVTPLAEWVVREVRKVDPTLDPENSPPPAPAPGSTPPPKTS